MFQCHFLSNFSAELNEMCCASSLNSILEVHIFLKTLLICFLKKVLNVVEFVLYFLTQIIKNVLVNKPKKHSCRFLHRIMTSSMCVKLFTAFEPAVSNLCTLARDIKSKMATISMKTKCGGGGIVDDCSH